MIGLILVKIRELLYAKITVTLLSIRVYVYTVTLPSMYIYEVILLWSGPQYHSSE